MGDDQENFISIRGIRRVAGRLLLPNFGNLKDFFGVAVIIIIMMPAKHPVLKVSVVVRALGVVIGFLLLAGIGTQFLKYQFGRPNQYGLVAMFSLDGEANLSAYFSSLQLLAAAGLLTLIACDQRGDRRFARYWLVLAVGFFLMSADEIISLHERLADPMRALLGGEKSGIWYVAWVIPAIVVVAALGVYFIPFLGLLPKSTRWEFIVAGTLFIGGAVGVEVLEGRYIKEYGQNNMGFSLYVFVEEGLEMIGVLVFIRALLRYLAGSCRAMVINVDAGKPSPASLANDRVPMPEAAH